MLVHGFLGYHTFVQLYYPQIIFLGSLNVQLQVHRLDCDIIEVWSSGYFSNLYTLFPDVVLEVQFPQLIDGDFGLWIAEPE